MRSKTRASRYSEGRLPEMPARRVGGLQIKVLSGGAEFEGLSVFHITMPPRYCHALLYHERTSEWFYVLEGKMTVIIDNDSKKLAPGHFIYIAPGVPHIVSSSREQVKVLVLFNPPMNIKKPDIHLVQADKLNGHASKSHFL